MIDPSDLRLPSDNPDDSRIRVLRIRNNALPVIHINEISFVGVIGKCGVRSEFVPEQIQFELCGSVPKCGAARGIREDMCCYHYGNTRPCKPDPHYHQTKGPWHSRELSHN